MAIEKYRETFITCPYCGYVRVDYCDYPWGPDFDKDEDCTDVDCEKCEKTFEVKLHVDYCFSSYQIEGDEDV